MTFELALGVWAVVTLLALVAAVWLLAVLAPRQGSAPRETTR